MKLLIALFVCCKVLHVTAQYSNCTKILRKLGDNFFDALRKVESDGDQCRISDGGHELGPYQISEKYYKEAVEFDITLKAEGITTMLQLRSKNYEFNIQNGVE